MTAKTQTNAAYIGIGVTLSNATLINTDAGVITGPGIAVYGRTGSSDTVVNAGLLSGGSNTIHSIGVVLDGGGTVTNSASGRIYGISDGVRIAASGTVINQGVIAGTNHAGIELDAGGFVSNASTGLINGDFGIIADDSADTATIVNAGYVRGVDSSAIQITSVSGSVLNTGTIISLFSQDGVNVFGATEMISNAAGGFISGYYGIQGGAGASTKVVNAGTIIGNAVGIQLNGGGTVSNAATGYINAGSWGVRSTGATAKVANAGFINHGVELLAGGTVTNQGGGTIQYGVYLAGGTLVNQAGAKIDGDFGVYGFGSTASTVVNSGTIISATDIPLSISSVALFAGGRITNTASGRIIGKDGIWAANVAATVVNSGIINGTATGAAVMGVYLQAGGQVVNSGVVTDGVEVVGGQVTNQITGTISGFTGVSAHSVVNAGLIQGVGTGPNTAVSIPGGSMTNLSTGTISGNTGIADPGHTLAVTVVNFGKVTGSGEFGISLGGQGTVTNAGTISGGKYAVDFTASTSNRVIFDPGARFIGKVDGGLTHGSSLASTLELASAAAAGTLTGLGTQFTGFSQIVIDPGSTWVFDNTDTIGAGQTLIIDNGSLTDKYPLVNNGIIQFDPGVLTVGGLTGSGTTMIEPGSTLVVLGTIVSTETVVFNGAGGDLILGDPSLNAGTIATFTPGNTIDLGGITNVASVDLLSGDTLQITLESGGPIDFAFTGDYTGDTFHYRASGGDTLITTAGAVPCYLAGTRIRTSGGETPVEKLRIGDRVMTRDGSLKPIKWIGRRGYAGAIPSGLRDVIPILIQAGALADHMPQRDLIVSPLHAMYLDGVLVPAELLINGVTIRRCPEIDPIRYFHIELDRHDIIYAEGAPAETFVDCDSRSMFHNAAEFDVLYAADPSQRWLYCAPRVDGGPTLDLIRRALDKRAGIDTQAADVPPGRLQGRLDGIQGGRISGWAFNPDRPSEPVWLEIRDGDGTLGRVHANRYRADLEAAGIGDGRHGFELHLAGKLGGRRQIRARRVQDGFELDGSPLLIETPDSDALLEDARRVIAAAILDPADAGALDRLADELLHGVDALRQLHASPPTERKRQRRALFIDSVLPRTDHDAGSQAVLSHAAALTELGFQVEFAATHELARIDATAATLEQAGYMVHRAPRIASVEEVLRRHRNGFDIVYMHRLINAEAYAPLVRSWQTRARLVYSVADLHHIRLARQAVAQASEETATAARAMRAREFSAMRLCDTVITHSTAEAAYLAKTAPSAAVHVVPWTPLVKPRPMPFAARRDAVAIGSWSHQPNVDAVRWLVSDIMPRVWRHAPINLMIAGSDWPSHVPWIADPRVRLVGPVPSMDAMLATPRLSVAALRFGAGLKGKVLDSFAAEVPCVMTPIAAEGFPLQDSLYALVTDDPETMASLIVRLHDDAAFNRAAAQDGLAMTAGFSAKAVRQAMANAVGSRTARETVSSAGLGRNRTLIAGSLDTR